MGHGGGPRGGALLGRALQLLETLLALLGVGTRLLLALLGVGARLLLELGEPPRVLRRDDLQLLLALALDRVDLRPAREASRRLCWHVRYASEPQSNNGRALAWRT